MFCRPQLCPCVGDALLGERDALSEQIRRRSVLVAGGWPVREICDR
jgi:hypothetical protein